MNTNMLLAAMQLAHRAADMVNTNIAVSTVRFSYPFISTGLTLWHCVIESKLDVIAEDGDDDDIPRREFLGVGDSPQSALSAAIMDATNTIRKRAARDQVFMTEHRFGELDEH